MEEELKYHVILSIFSQSNHSLHFRPWEGYMPFFQMELLSQMLRYDITLCAGFSFRKAEATSLLSDD
jgi:hypothetical protein